MPQMCHLPCLACIAGDKHSLENPCKRASGKKCHQSAESDCDCTDMPAKFHDRLVSLQVHQKKFEGRSSFLKNRAAISFATEIKTLGDDARAWVAEENSRIEAEREEERRKQALEDERRRLLEAFDNGEQLPGPLASADGNGTIVAALEGIRVEIQGWRNDVRDTLECFKKQKAEDREVMVSDPYIKA
ncbi:hypothetical protein KEM55_006860, partial [Ascosphaera atra]